MKRTYQTKRTNISVPTNRFNIIHPWSGWKNEYPRFSPRSFKNTWCFYEFFDAIFSSRGFGAETFQFNINKVLRRLGVWNHTSRAYIQASKSRYIHNSMFKCIGRNYLMIGVNGEGVRKDLRHPLECSFPQYNQTKSSVCFVDFRRPFYLYLFLGLL